ncbi:MAG: hypothetical protein ACRC5C_08970 [Bacilli bacterium]
MKFLTLLELELKKLAPIVLGIFGTATAMIAYLFYSNIDAEKAQLIGKLAGQTFAEYAAENGPYTLAFFIDSSMWFTVIFFFVGLSILGLTLYTWYKEWFGQSKRIYMLLTLSGSRLQVLGSKLAALTLVFVSYYLFVLVNLYIGGLLMSGLLDAALVGENLVQNALQQSLMMSFILPGNIADLAYKFAFGVMMMLIMTTFVMMDRSKRVIGALVGVVFGASTVVVFFYLNTLHLFADEFPIVMWGFVGIVSAVCLAISTYLLQKKVSI